MKTVKMEKAKKVRDRWVNVRMNQEEFEKLESNRKKATERSNSDYIRKLVTGQPVKILTRNASQDALTEELIRLRKELNAIGQNLNQAVRKLHSLKMIPEFRNWITAYEHTCRQVTIATEAIVAIIQKKII
jgi:hypothetical protein